MGIVERIDAVTAIPAAYLREDPPAPRSVKIELTSRCNYRCTYCSLKDRASQSNQDMDFDLFKRITTEMRAAGVEEIGVFYIGESFSAPALLISAIEWCKRGLGFPYVFCTTNGSMARPEVVLDCMEVGLNSLKFSINAADDEQFEAVMGVKSKLFTKALENLKEARAIRDNGGFKCGIYASSIQFAGKQAEKMHMLLEEHVLPFVDEHYFLPLFGQMAQADEARAVELGFVPTAGNQGRIGALRNPLPCWAVSTEGHVRADGHLSACCFGADDKFDMGDLTKQSFMAAWHSDAFRELRRAHLARDVTGSVCEDCVAY